MTYYLLFRGSSHWPDGGMADCVGAYASFDEVQAAKFGPSFRGGDSWVHIVEVGGDGVTLVDVWDLDVDDPDGGPSAARAGLRKAQTWRVGDTL